jgi:hypothetical protein
MVKYMGEPRHISEIIKEVLPILMLPQDKGRNQTQGGAMLLRLRNEIKKRGLHANVKIS